MAKYLDGGGLSRLWERIKTYVSESILNKVGTYTNEGKLVIDSNCNVRFGILSKNTQLSTTSGSEYAQYDILIVGDSTIDLFQLSYGESGIKQTSGLLSNGLALKAYTGIGIIHNNSGNYNVSVYNNINKSLYYIAFKCNVSVSGGVASYSYTVSADVIRKDDSHLLSYGTDTRFAFIVWSVMDRYLN